MAKGFDCGQFSRQVVIGINALFLLLGIAMVIVGIVGYNQLQSSTNQAYVLQDFDLPNIMIVILCSGLGTVLTSLFGCLGAWKRWENVLKLYASIVTVVVCIQIAMGAYLLNLNIDSLQSTWATETVQGTQNRVSFQNYLGCCGWSNWYDSIGQLTTPCPYLPTITNPALPTTCRQATLNFVHKYMGAIAAAAITIAVIELVSLFATCFVIFDGKRRGVETGFEY